nr:hypothetical protein [uncultured Cohaesibacter sp.]
MRINSVLVLDDEQTSLELIEMILKSSLEVDTVVLTKFPSEAVKLANIHFFDLVLIDVTLQYKGSPFGGLEVYSELAPRYGKSSLLAYSSYVTDDLLKKYDFPFNFCEKLPNAGSFRDVLKSSLQSLRERQSCFVAMPFSDEYNGLFKSIKSAIQSQGYRCIRVDEEHFTQSIVDKILDEIIKCKLVVFVASGNNPNVFFELGYSVALRKEVVSITNSHSNLPFDIRDRNAISYNTDLKYLQESIRNRIYALTIVR